MLFMIMAGSGANYTLGNGTTNSRHSPTTIAGTSLPTHYCIEPLHRTILIMSMTWQSSNHTKSSRVLHPSITLLQ